MRVGQPPVLMVVGGSWRLRLQQRAVCVVLGSCKKMQKETEVT